MEYQRDSFVRTSVIAADHLESLRFMIYHRRPHRTSPHTESVSKSILALVDMAEVGNVTITDFKGVVHRTLRRPRLRFLDSKLVLPLLWNGQLIQLIKG